VGDQAPGKALAGDEPRSLEGKVVVVTGAGRGLGEAYARSLASAGAAVVVNDIDGSAASSVAASVVGAGGRAVGDGHTVADPIAAWEIIHAAVTAFGRLDGLVNNAGVFYVAAPEDDDPSQAASMVQTNLLGTVYCGLHAIRQMVHQGWGGVIVNDTSGAQSGMSRRGVYGATKGATASLTYSWASDLRRHAIRVNAISPIARTAMVDYGVALGEAGTEWPPSHVAPLVTYLMGNDAAGVTGQVIRLDGRSLSLQSRPGAQRWVATSDHWDHAAIAAAVERLLAEQG
jgi:NAD(P)-dependent dehydrogenase (short-subunit alcohol dehydrogenase family)